MPRRRRPGRTAAPEEQGRLRAPLAALFPDGLPAPPPPPPPQPRLISETELMARAFAALAGGDAVDFDALRVVTRLPHATGRKQQVPADSPKFAPPGRARGPDSEQGDVTPLAADERRGSGVEPASAPAPHSPTGASPPAGPAREVAALQHRSWAGSGWRDEPGRNREHARAAAELVARARRGRLPTLRLRGLRREPALAALVAFVARERAARSRYVRVVTGKGLGSPGDPVLKEALAEWCASAAGETEVAAWAPELDVRGEYGAVILQLRPLD